MDIFLINCTRLNVQRVRFSLCAKAGTTVVDDTEIPSQPLPLGRTSAGAEGWKPRDLRASV